MRHRVAKHDRFVLQSTERNTGLQNTTDSPWPLLRITLRSIRQSADSGRASSSFTSVGGNTSASRPAPSASWPPQTPSIASALKARYLMVLTVPSDLSRARHRPGLHSEMAAIRPSHRARSSTSGPGESRQVFVPLELSSELCPSPNLRPTSDRRPRSVLKATADQSTHNLAHLGPSSPFAFTVNIRMGHWGRGTNVAKPNA
jgi:hypothetical protein